MITHIPTPFVQILGNSVFFRDRFDDLPQVIQPFLFYPDWFFMTWPFHWFFAATHDWNGVYMTNDGLVVCSFAFFWFILGCILGACRVNTTFNSFVDKDWAWPLRVPYQILMYFLFWHIYVADMIGTLATAFFWPGYEVSMAFRKLVFFAMLAPPIVVIVWRILLLVQVL